jgi:hypothetical protein
MKSARIVPTRLAASVCASVRPKPRPAPPPHLIKIAFGGAVLDLGLGVRQARLHRRLSLRRPDTHEETPLMSCMPHQVIQ